MAILDWIQYFMGQKEKTRQRQEFEKPWTLPKKEILPPTADIETGQVIEKPEITRQVPTGLKRGEVLGLAKSEAGHGFLRQYGILPKERKATKLAEAEILVDEETGAIIAEGKGKTKDVSVHFETDDEGNVTVIPYTKEGKVLTEERDIFGPTPMEEEPGPAGGIIRKELPATRMFPGIGKKTKPEKPTVFATDEDKESYTLFNTAYRDLSKEQREYVDQRIAKRVKPTVFATDEDKESWTLFETPYRDLPEEQRKYVDQKILAKRREVTPAQAMTEEERNYKAGRDLIDKNYFKFNSLNQMIEMIDDKLRPEYNAVMQEYEQQIKKGADPIAAANYSMGKVKKAGQQREAKIQKERDQALKAIERGADKKQIQAEFKKRTGEDLAP